MLAHGAEQGADVTKYAMTERTYASALKEKMEHAPVAHTEANAARDVTEDQRGEAIEPELVAAVTGIRRHAEFHPTIATAGEKLPDGFARSCAGFLLCNTVLEVKVDQATVKKEMENLQKHAVVAYFVGGKQTPLALNQWIAALQSQVGDWVGLGRDLGKGFFQVLTRQPATTQKVLMYTPHRSRWGTCILQTWTTGFDSGKPSRLKVPTWVTLRGIPGEFLGVAKEIAGGLGELLGSDKRNATCADQRFCVALQAGQGWKTQLSVTNENMGEKVIISVDYCNLPIRCRCCQSTDHLIKDCPGIKAPNSAGETQPSEDQNSAAAGPPQQLEAGATIPSTHSQGAAVDGSTGGVPRANEPQHMGTNSESTTSRSGNHYSNGDSRLTPEYEWNGWENVPRHKRPVCPNIATTTARQENRRQDGPAAKSPALTGGGGAGRSGSQPTRNGSTPGRVRAAWMEEGPGEQNQQVWNGRVGKSPKQP